MIQLFAAKRGAIKMRKLVGSLFISLDMVAEAPDQWQFDNFDEDMMAEMGVQLARQDALLMGRVTYQDWSQYWPTATDEPFASWINNIPKYVASTTLKSVEWGKFNNATLLKGSLAEEIGKLKQLPGKNIAVTGSIGLMRSLLQQDLLDELNLQVHPVIVNKGKKLFQEGDNMKRLKLVNSKISRTGVAILGYEPRR
jgi:dihydrofolate reductase